MTVTLLLLPVVFLVALGWVAGLYLLVYWLNKKMRNEEHSAWRRIWEIGGLVFVVGSLLRTFFDAVPTVGTIGIFLTFVSPFLWLAAYLRFRKIKVSTQATKKIDYGEPQEGVWPPPPNVPK